MRRAQITKAGQMSVPAAIRSRWETRTVVIEDRGDHFIVRPAPADPIAAFRGSFKGRGPSSDEGRRIARDEERRREEAKAGRRRRKTRSE
jgi:bifunctional DNA-binding transcriptional regulator/antitoxin component of YhaV-PrlF toxin-antitoxin module